jgi:hypothetical protein
MMFDTVMDSFVAEAEPWRNVYVELSFMMSDGGRKQNSRMNLSTFFRPRTMTHNKLRERAGFGPSSQAQARLPLTPFRLSISMPSLHVFISVRRPRQNTAEKKASQRGEVKKAQTESAIKI